MHEYEKICKHSRVQQCSQQRLYNVSGTGFRLVTTATMADYHNLNEIKCGVIVGTQEKGHRLSMVAMHWGFSRMTISRFQNEYWELVKTSNH